MTDRTNSQSSGTPLPSTTPVKGYSVKVTKVSIEEFGIRYYISPYSKWITVSLALHSNETKDLPHCSLDIPPNQNYIFIKTVYNDPMKYEEKEYEHVNRGDSLMRLTLKPGDIIGVITRIFEL